MNPYPPKLAEALVKAEQAAGLAVDDLRVAYRKAADDEALTIVLERALGSLTSIMFTLRRLTGCAFLALILSAQGCATARSQLVATWEPQPDVRVAYCVDLGSVPRIKQTH